MEAGDDIYYAMANLGGDFAIYKAKISNKVRDFEIHHSEQYIPITLTEKYVDRSGEKGEIDRTGDRILVESNFLYHSTREMAQSLKTKNIFKWIFAIRW